MLVRHLQRLGRRGGRRPGRLSDPGLSARPEAIIFGVALALGLVEQKASPVELKQVEFPIDAYLRNKAWEERNVIYRLLKD